MNANVHELRRHGRQLTTIKDPLEQITTFLGTPLPSDFKMESGDEVSLLEYDPDIVSLVRERRPAVWIDRCIAIKRMNTSGKPLFSVWGTTRFTEKLVEGHFPGRPVVPFIYLVWQIAQCASIAAALQGNDPTKAPVGIGSDGSGVEAEDIIDAPATILASVSVEALKMGLCKFAPSFVYNNGIKIGAVNGIRYFLRPSQDIPIT